MRPDLQKKLKMNRSCNYESDKVLKSQLKLPYQRTAGRALVKRQGTGGNFNHTFNDLKRITIHSKQGKLEER
jgi:hypothetical protein